MKSHVVSNIVPVLVCLAVQGCASIDIGEAYKALEPITHELTKCTPTEVKGRMATRQPAPSSAVMQTIPTTLAKEQVVTSVSALYAQSDSTAQRGRDGTQRTRGQTPKPASTLKYELSTRDIESFAREFTKTVLNPAVHLFEGPPEQAGRSADGDDSSVSLFFKHYYKEFIKGNYVDRFGVKLSKPEIKGSIGNDAITGALAIFLDAWADAQLKTPLLTKAGKDKQVSFVTAGGKVPTASNVKTAAGQFVVERIEVIDEKVSDQCGITEKEAAGIVYLANLAAERSALFSGLLVESFGGLELSAVIGGHFSIGDNKTLAAVAKTLFEVVSKRLTERVAYDIFEDYGYESTAEGARSIGAPRSPISSFLKDF